MNAVLIRSIISFFVLAFASHLGQCVCPVGFWSSPSCDMRCYCLQNQSCYEFSGLCPGGKCDTTHYNASCGSLLPKLSDAPNVTSDACLGVTVRWKPWQANVDIGENVKSILKYIIIVHNGSTKSEVSLSNSATEYSMTVVEGIIMSFGVKFRFLSEFGTEHVGLASPASPSENFTCNVIPIVDLTVAANGSVLEMTWDVKKANAPSAGDIREVELTWAAVKYGDCLSYPSPLSNGSFVSATASSKRSVDTGQMWTTFLVTMTAKDSAGKQATVSKTILTGEVRPNGTVTSFSITNRQDTFVQLTWAPPSCINRGGVALRYLVNVVFADTLKPVREGVNVNVPSHNVTGLSPGTGYTAWIVVENAIGQSPRGVFNFTTTGTKPTTTAATAVTSGTTPTIPTTALTTTKGISSTSSATLTTTEGPTTTLDPTAPSKMTAAVPAIGDNFVQLSWEMPLNSPAVRFRLSSSPPVALPQDLAVKTYRVTTGLVTKTTYTFLVSAKVNNNWSQWTVSNQVMLLSTSDQPQNPKVIPPTSGNSVNFSWTPLPDASTFKVNATTTSCLPNSRTHGKSTTKEFAATNSSTLTGLEWACQWDLMLTPVFTNGGFSRDGLSTKFPAFWTGPGPMPKPPVPKLVGAAEVNKVLVNLTRFDAFTNGPLEYYLLVIKDSQKRRRRRAAPSPSELGVPSQARFVLSNFTFSVATLPVSVGGGTSGSANPPLAANTAYTLYFAGWSRVPAVASTSTNFATLSFKTAAAPAAFPVWVIIVVIVLILLLILLLIIFLLWRRRSQRLRSSQSQNMKLTLRSNGTLNGHHHVPSTFLHWSETERMNDARYLVLDPTYGPRDLKVEAIRDRDVSDDYESFEKEYRNLPCGLMHDCHTGRLPMNLRKNRNPDILPYDHCRVTLDRIGTDTDGGDYINASYIDGYLRRRAFIAAQSPFNEDTAADFWLMVYQCNVFQIVMLTEMLEEATLKCTQYWPEVGCAEQYGAVHVTGVSEEDFAHHSIRTFHLLLKGGQVRGAMQTVQQFQFRSWPDHGVPDSAIPLLDFYTRVKLRTQQHMGPMLVHCGTGISRTAVFIALDSLLQQAIYENVVNVFKFCMKMRRARPNMIRTSKQYMFLYDLIFDALLASNNVVNLDVRETLKELVRKNEATGHTLLWEQHCILEKYTPGPTDASCAAALLPENRTRNRLSAILPSDEHRVRLFSGPASADYINAVFLDSLFAKEDVIITQIPSHQTLADFWRMLSDHRVGYVVDLETNHHGREDAVKWMPEDNGVSTFGTFTVRTRLDSQPEELVSVRRAVINEGEHTVKVLNLRPGSWDDTYVKVPADRVALVALVHELISNVTFSNGPIVFLCLDGATRSGLGAAAFLTSQQLATEHFVDVFHIVRAMKQRRPQVIAHQEQYRFLFKFLHDYVRRYMRSELEKELKTESLYGHLPSGDLESIYSHSQVPVLHTSHKNGANGVRHSGVHYRYASSEMLNSNTFA